MRRIHQEGTLFDVELKAHRSNKEKQEPTPFERFVTEGHARAEELATDGAMLEGGEMTQIKACTVPQRREEVYAALQHEAFIVWWRRSTIVKSLS